VRGRRNKKKKEKSQKKAPDIVRRRFSLHVMEGWDDAALDALGDELANAIDGAGRQIFPFSLFSFFVRSH
jgi:hypothetical protein